MSTLTKFKAAMKPGVVVEVTNHYITREDHPAYGITTRRVAKANSASFYLEYLDGACPGPLAWPKASMIGASPMGTTFNIDYPGKPGVQFLSIRLKDGGSD